MGKQYTFKTTRDTAWLEPVLDGLTGKERSATIRSALTLYFDNVRPAVTQTSHVTPDVPLVVSHRDGQTMVEKGNTPTEWTPSPIDEPEIEAQEADLDSVLDNLNF